MKNENYLKILRLGIYFTLLLPLFVSGKFFHPFSFPRVVVFRTAIELLFIVWILLVGRDRRYLPKPNILFWGLAVLGGVFILTALTGVDPSRSFWGTMERGNGVFSWLHYFAFFVILISVFSEKKDWLNLFKFSVGVSLIISLYALGQRLGLPSLLESGIDRATGTIGNAAFLASYLILSIGLVLVLFFSKDFSLTKEKPQAEVLSSRRRELHWRIFYCFVLFFNLLALYLTATRGAMVGLVAGFFVFCLFFLIFVPTGEDKEGRGRDQRRIKNIKKYIAIGLAIAVLLTLCLWILRNSPLIEKIPGLERYVRISLTEGTAKTRIWAWQTAWQGWKEKFWFGWGPVNFNIVFNKYFNPRFYEFGKGESWFDNAHNIVFDIGTTSGLIGVLAYLSVFGAALCLLWKIRRKEALPAVLLAAILAAYFVQNLFIFDVFNSYLLFFLILGYIYFLSAESRPINQNLKANAAKSPILHRFFSSAPFIVFLSLLFILLAWQVNLKPLIANYWSAQTYKLSHQPKTIEALNDPQKGTAAYQRISDLYERTLSYQTYGDVEIRIELAGFIYNQTENVNIDKTLKEKEFAFAISQVEESIAAHPLDARWYLFLAKLCQGKAQALVLDGEEQEGQFDGQLLQKAEESIVKGIELSPKKIALYHVLLQNILMREKYQEALEKINLIISIYPGMADTYWYLGLTNIGLRNETSAVLAIDRALDLGYGFQNTDDLRLAAALYSQRHNLEKLEIIYKQAIRLEPKNLQWYASLATVYSESGDKEKARETALKIIEIDPGSEQQVYDFLRTLE